MLDLIMGLIIGRNTTKTKQNTYITEEHKEEIEITKVIGYVHIPELDNLDATLESCYIDYKETDLVCIHRDSMIIYYLEVEVPYNQIMWGDKEILKNI